MKWTRTLALVGVVILVVGLAFLWSLRRWQLAAAGLDRNPDPEGPVTGDPAGCGRLVEPEVALPRRVMALQETQALTVILSSAAAESCQVAVALNAPHFLLSPLEPRQQVTVGPGQRAQVTWILLPQEVGTFDLVLTVGGGITVLGITVTNALGLTAGQLQILSALSTVLGPMLTVPWWYERWQAWRARRRREEEKKEEATPIPFE